MATCHCEELDFWSKAVGWETDYRQIGKGSFEAWFDTSVTAEFRAVEQFCSKSMAVTGAPPQGHLPILMVLNEGSRGRFQGRELKEGQAVAMCPGSESTFQTPEDLHMLTVALPVERLKKSYSILTGEDLDPLIGETRLLSMPQGVSENLIALARESIYTPTSGEAPDLCQTEREYRFIEGYLSLIAGPDFTKGEVLHPHARAKYVLAARDYIESHLASSLGLEIISEAVSVSPRTLEYAFRDIFDITLVHYIKIRRLNAVRSTLLEATPGSLKIGSVARNYGFSHLGYFSRDYRQLFGEHPSSTLSASTQ
tara:strand:+ start:1550 stop:2482 length:933 start_codon:yes stop_codon:yes gene_type:complete